MKGQINVEFLVSALLYLLIVGSILTIGSEVLPDFSEDKSRASLNTEAYQITTQILKEPGYSEAYGGTVNWEKNSTTVTGMTAFGLTNDSDEFNRIKESKLENLKSFSIGSSENFTYSDFKNLTGVENQYLMNFTWKPIVKTDRSFDRGELNENLVAYWSFDQTSGPIRDIYKYDNNGINYSIDRGRNGVDGTNSFFFDGQNDFIYTENNPNLRISSPSISFWLNTNYSQPEENDSDGWPQSGWIIDKDVKPPQSNDWSAVLKGGKIIWNTGTEDPSVPNSSEDHILKSDQKVSDGSWHHIVLTRDESTGVKKIFIDGTLDNETISSKGDLSNSKPINIGMENDGTGNFKGRLADIRLYNRPISTEEVKELYRREKPFIVQPNEKNFNNSGNLVHYGSKKLQKNEYRFLITSKDGKYNSSYISKNWNFRNKSIGPVGKDEKFNLYNKNFTISSFQNRPRSPGNLLILSKHLKEFGPEIDSDSTVIRMDRYAILNGEPLSIKVLAW